MAGKSKKKRQKDQLTLKITSSKITSSKVASSKVTSPKVTSSKVTTSKVVSPKFTSPKVKSPTVMPLKTNLPKVTSPKVKSPRVKSPNVMLPKFTVGSKVEAMDFLGNWYAAKVMQLKENSTEVLVHFDGWNSRFDAWLPSDSKKLRLAKLNKYRAKEKQWRIGDRVIAKWGPAGKLYPATVSKITSETNVEVTFYDGFKKSINKSSLKADCEKLYRQYVEGSARKNIVVPLQKEIPSSTAMALTIATMPVLPPEPTVEHGRSKRKLTEPAAMADYITDLHSKRRTKRGSDRSTSEDDRPSGTGKPLPSSTTEFSTESKSSGTSIPKVKFNMQNDSVTICKKDEKDAFIAPTQVPQKKEKKDETVISKKIKPSGVEIVKKKNKSYLMFPVMTLEDEKEKQGDPVKLENISEKEVASIAKQRLSAMQKVQTLSDFSSKGKFHLSTKIKVAKESNVDESDDKKKVQDAPPPPSNLNQCKTEKNMDPEKISVKEPTKSSINNETVENGVFDKNTPPAVESKHTCKNTSPSVEMKIKSKNATKERSLRLKKKTAKILVSQKKVEKSKKSEHGKKFEEKYELFKLKWKEEKERRRKILQQQNESLLASTKSSIIANENSVSSPPKMSTNNVSIPDENSVSSPPKMSTNNVSIPDENSVSSPPKMSMNEPEDIVQKVVQDKIDKIIVTEDISLTKKQTSSKVIEKHRPRIKHTPTSKFGRGLVQKHKQRQIHKRGRGRPPKIEEESLNADDKQQEGESVVPAMVEKQDIVSASDKKPADTATQNDMTVDSNSATVVPLPRAKSVGWPKGKPRKKKPIGDADFVPEGYVEDISRTPNMSNTLSFASMVAEERPSQRRRPEPSKVTLQAKNAKSFSKTQHPTSIFKPSNRYVVQGPNRSFFSYPVRIPHQNLSAAQIVAAKIQKRVHQKIISCTSDGYPPVATEAIYPFAEQVQEEKQNDSKLIPNSMDKETDGTERDSDDAIIVVQPCDDLVENKTEECCNELDLTGIELKAGNKSVFSKMKPVIKKRKSLDFITGRLQYKQRIEAYKKSGLQMRKVSPQTASYRMHDTTYSPSSYVNMAPSNTLSSVMEAGRQYSPSGPPQCAPMNVQVSLSQPMMGGLHQQLNVPPHFQHPSLYHHAHSQLQSPPGQSRMISPSLLLGSHSNNRQVIPTFAQSVMQTVPCIQQISPNKNPYPTHFFPPHADTPAMPPCTKPNCHCNHGKMSHALTSQNQPVVSQPLPHHSVAPHMQRQFQHVMTTQPQPPTSLYPPNSTFLTMPSRQQAEQQHLPIQPNIKSALTALLTKKRKADKKLDEGTEEKTGTGSGNKDNAEKEQSKNVSDQNSTVRGEHTKKKKRRRVSLEKENGYQFRKDRASSKKGKLDQDNKMLAPKEFSVESPLDEYKCSVVGCNKTFRKSHLLEYHHKYYHTIKPSTKRSRSSMSISSTDSNPVSALPSPMEPSGIKAEDLVRLISFASEAEFPEHSDVTDSDTETESGDELPSVDDCVKCVCEDECELGFMIQCEQCFTWQHGECVGYSQQKNVPLFYLCHVCSKPKGLRKSSYYSNDYTWYRHGRLPSTSHRKSEVDDDLDAKQVDAENEEVLSNIMLTTHRMVTELSNIRDVLQGIRHKFILCKNDPNHPVLTDWRVDVDIEASLVEQMKKEHEGKTTKKITEDFDKNLNDMIDSIRKNNHDTDDTNVSKETSGENEIDTVVTRVTDKDMNKGKTDSPVLAETHNTADIGNQENDKSSDGKRMHEPSNNNSSSKAQPHHEKTSSNIKVAVSSGKLSIKQEPEDGSEVSRQHSSKNDVINIDEDSIPYMESDDDDWHETSKNEKPASPEHKDVKSEVSQESCRDFDKIFEETCLENASRENLLARYHLLVEVEKIEEEICKRLKEMEDKLVVLEAEYDSIDQSKTALEEFKSTFKLPDMQSLMTFLNKVKWTSIINSTSNSKNSTVPS